jgi:hypothetical protein
MLHATKVRVKGGQAKSGHTNGQDPVLLSITDERKSEHVQEVRCLITTTRLRLLYLIVAIIGYFCLTRSTVSFLVCSGAQYETVHELGTRRQRVNEWGR